MKYASVGNPAEPQNRVEKMRHTRLYYTPGHCDFPTRLSVLYSSGYKREYYLWSSSYPAV